MIPDWVARLLFIWGFVALGCTFAGIIKKVEQKDKESARMLWGIAATFPIWLVVVSGQAFSYGMRNLWKMNPFKE